MSKGMQLYPFPMKTPTFTLNGKDTLSMETLPDTIFNRIAHLVSFMIDVYVVPTFTTAPTINGIMSILNNLVFFDGFSERQNISGQLLRLANIVENGKQIVPDPDTDSGTGNAFAFRIPLLMGPPSSAGYPTDYLIPCAALKSAELRFTFGGLTDFSADCTALNNVNIRVTAMLAALDNQVRVPPAFERRSYNFGTNEAIIQGKALYPFAFMTKQSLAAFSAADLGEVTIDTGIGSVPSIITSSLTAIAQMETRAGIITQLRGEPRAATDDNEKTVNLGTPTALKASDAIVQSLIHSPDGHRTSKCLFEATSAMRVKWTGNFATPTVTVGRILEQPVTAQAAMATRAIAALGKNVPSASKVKTLEGRDYSGPRELYLPRVFTW